MKRPSYFARLLSPPAARATLRVPRGVSMRGPDSVIMPSDLPTTMSARAVQAPLVERSAASGALPPSPTTTTTESSSRAPVSRTPVAVEHGAARSVPSAPSPASLQATPVQHGQSSPSVSSARPQVQLAAAASTQTFRSIEAFTAEQALSVGRETQSAARDLLSARMANDARVSDAFIPVSDILPSERKAEQRAAQAQRLLIEHAQAQRPPIEHAQPMPVAPHPEASPSRQRGTLRHEADEATSGDQQVEIGPIEVRLVAAPAAPRPSAKPAPRATTLLRTIRPAFGLRQS